MGSRIIKVTREFGVDDQVEDSQAPERPLTPYFLWLQTARSIILQKLGPDVPTTSVPYEAARRWKDLNAEMKQVIYDDYKHKQRRWRARMHSYRKGNVNAKDMTKEEAAAYADEHGIEFEERGSQLPASIES